METTFFLIQVRGMINVLLEIFFANKDTSVALAIHFCSLSLFHQMMSLYIDTKIIRPWNFAGSPILFMNSWIVDELQCSECWEIFHWNSIGSPSIVPTKVLCCGESLNQPNCSSQTVFMLRSGSPFQGITQNLTIREPTRSRD